ncbi:MAG TPA: hypothetical protein VMT64_08180 [Candidatus Binataceae bacterium]|nr:hypothetical protein [Candidatus Binataceae bacterium]
MRERCPDCSSHTLLRHVGPKHWVSRQVGHYTASCTRCGEMFWRHEDVSQPRTETPWQAEANACGCTDQQPELI